ncbi:hypothetical protein ABWK39_22710 [Bacillus toyonensis]|uniref:hypothetical protein n=1 Tax=Bacillus toyonensis TaxID=155322 RepID=UPI000BEDD406|nr:hypothetical protein [Bacillus toyonensis]PED94037.1 hypothetical protein CON90_14565 [Bacillus toyonensis]PEK41658.1 hypothetical protein CN588_27535 [Bacillus toyonensis]PEL63133.1 hypothetical protein CN633_05450 [Bacillus toyonensis]PFZ39099.1 hypothetical protein COL64_06600 [Bacillus toyonensis]
MFNKEATISNEEIKIVIEDLFVDFQQHLAGQNFANGLEEDFIRIRERSSNQEQYIEILVQETSVNLELILMAKQLLQEALINNGFVDKSKLKIAERLLIERLDEVKDKYRSTLIKYRNSSENVLSLEKAAKYAVLNMSYMNMFCAGFNQAEPSVLTSLFYRADPEYVLNLVAQACQVYSEPFVN